MAKSDDGPKLRNKAGSSGDEKSPTKPVAKIKNVAIAPMLTLLLFSTAMLILPLGTYFVIRHYIVRSTTISAMGAIIMVQLIVAAYIYKAWNDENKEHESKIKDKLKKR